MIGITLALFVVPVLVRVIELLMLNCDEDVKVDSSPKD